MRHLVTLVLLIFFCQLAKAQSFGIGTDTPDSEAMLEIVSTDKGMLIPRMTTIERDAITVANAQDNGLLIYNITTDEFNYWDGTQWLALQNSNNNSKWIDAGDRIYPVDPINKRVIIGNTIISPVQPMLTVFDDRQDTNPSVLIDRSSSIADSRALEISGAFPDGGSAIITNYTNNDIASLSSVIGITTAVNSSSHSDKTGL